MEIKKKISFFIVSFFLINLVYALIPPDLPDHFRGNLIIDEQDAPTETEIKIYVNNELESTTTTTIIGEYDLYVKTGYSGNEIKFKVNDIDAATYERQGGETINLDLEVYTDRDNDGVNDATDTLIGDKESIEDNYDNLLIKIDEETNLNGSFSGTKSIEFLDDTKTIISFEFNFDDNTLNLFDLEIKKQANGIGSIMVKGISNVTKTVYVDRLTSTNNAVCIKDQEILTIDEITTDCTGTDEIKLNCPGNNENYACSIENNRFKVEGLSHSGVKESYIAPSQPTDSGSSDDSGGGGGGGGGGGASTGKKTTNLEELPSYLGENGINMEGKVGDEFIFKDSKNKEHVVTISKLYTDRVLLNINSPDPLELILKIGETHIVDINKDKIISIKLSSITRGRANLNFKKLYSKAEETEITPLIEEIKTEPIREEVTEKVTEEGISKVTGAVTGLKQGKGNLIIIIIAVIAALGTGIYFIKKKQKV